VQPEDGVTSMGDYRLHMRMVEYAHCQFPKVHIALHAGELTDGLVKPEGLRFHIREAVEVGHAERIGHGVDLVYETGSAVLLKEMASKRIAVEINLTSNDLILGVRGANHPFPVYRKAGVPVVLSTDDEAVARTHLTNEYVRATLTYGLTYSDLKEIVRNSLEYSFLPGLSYWKSGTYITPIAACAGGRQTKSCLAFLAENQKAERQADLEDRFAEFERNMY
jgi:adenosine deaminase